MFFWQMEKSSRAAQIAVNFKRRTEIEFFVFFQASDASKPKAQGLPMATFAGQRDCGDCDESLPPHLPDEAALAVAPEFVRTEYGFGHAS